MDSLWFHRALAGKIKIVSKTPLKELATIYTPGVAEVSKEIAEKGNVEEYTMKQNFVAIVSNGTRVLGLGNVGPEAALPVMEGKAVILNEIASVDAIPLCINANTVEELVFFVKAIAPTFGAVILEDITTEVVLEVEEKLKGEIPIFHDDQHGTAIVTLAALINSVDSKEVKIAVVGAGSAGYGIAKLLNAYGFRNLVVFDSKGALHRSRSDLPKHKQYLANLNGLDYSGKLKKGFDVVISAAKPGAVKEEVLEGVKVLFALSNPTPEIDPETAKKYGVEIYGSGRSDLPNQINNAVCLPGFMKAILKQKIKRVEMKHMIAAAEAIAKVEKIIPRIDNPQVVGAIVDAIEKVENEKKN